jgi:hypothetical protein
VSYEGVDIHNTRHEQSFDPLEPRTFDVNTLKIEKKQQFSEKQNKNIHDFSQDVSYR